MNTFNQIAHFFRHLYAPKSHTFCGMLAVMTIAALLLWTKHCDWLKNANDYMLLDSPDAFKNY
ncbi:MAG: hypothetical protein ACKOCH_08275, partial [Bacteroidota bacterium]